MQTLDITFFALSDSTRRAILGQLAEGSCALGELAEPRSISQTAVSKHVRILERAGLVRIEKRGRVRYCSIDNASRLRDAYDWISSYETFWAEALDRLAVHLEVEAGDE